MLHSKIIGEGKPFVILHGFLGMGDNWKTLGKQFSEHGFEIHLVDQRNHGRSFHDHEFSYDVLASDLKAYCDKKGLKSIALLGHSMGGKTAMEFAMRYPEMLDKLVIADIGPKYYPQHHQQILNGLQALSENEAAMSGRKEADIFLANFIPELGVRMFLLKNLYWEQPGVLGLRMNLPVLTEKIGEVGKALEDGQSYNEPVLFLRGDRSDYILDEDVNEIVKIFAKAEIKTISKAGHWLHAENPQEFAKEVLNFL